VVYYPFVHTTGNWGGRSLPHSQVIAQRSLTRVTRTLLRESPLGSELVACGVALVMRVAAVAAGSQSARKPRVFGRGRISGRKPPAFERLPHGRVTYTPVRRPWQSGAAGLHGRASTKACGEVGATRTARAVRAARASPIRKPPKPSGERPPTCSLQDVTKAP
jgi:hypothetical protein